MMKRSSLPRFIFFLKPYAWMVSLATGAGILRYVIPLLIPWGIKVIIDDILRSPIESQNLARLHSVAFQWVGLYLLWTLLSFIRFYFTGLAGNRMIFDLRHQLYLHVQKMSLSFFEKQHIGSVVSRMTQDITAAQNLVGYGVTALLMDISCVFLIAGILWNMHWKLALVAFSVIPFYVWVSRFFSGRIRATSRKIQEQLGHLSGHIHEKFSGISVIQSFTQEKKEEEKFLESARFHFDTTHLNMKQQAWALSLTGFLAAVAPLVVIWFGAVCVIRQTLSVGELVAFYSYVGLLYTPVTRLTELKIVIANSLAAIDRIFEVLDTYPEVQEKKNASPFKIIRGEITFQNVSFSYARNTPILKEVNFTLPSQKKIVLTGANGSGKSTLIKLLLRFYDFEQGSILIDGKDIREMTLQSLRSQIAFVAQEPILFSGTILDNLLYGKKDATEAEIQEACEIAHAREFISRLPDQYLTQVGERGVLLSAGEKQRIAIARAYLKNAPILILDEPVSAVDKDSIPLIQESLKILSQRKTTLVIDHYSSLMDEADMILKVSHHQIKLVSKEEHSLRIADSVSFRGFRELF